MKIYFRPSMDTPIGIRLLIVLAHVIDALVRLFSLAYCYTNLPFEAKALEAKHVIRMRQKRYEASKRNEMGK